jgi:hypothetical protein
VTTANTHDCARLDRGRAGATLRQLAAVIVNALGLGVVTAPQRAGADLPPLATTIQTITDSLHDVVNTLTSSLFGSDRADITAASLEYGPGWIRMRMQPRNPTDPVRDPNWESAGTYATWTLDTNGDAKADYSVQYGIQDGELYGNAVRPNAGPDGDRACEADSATFAPRDGYTMVFDPECLGRPAAIANSVSMAYDTDVRNDSAPVAQDLVPAAGFAAAVAAPTARTRPLDAAPAPTKIAATVPATSPAAQVAAPLPVTPKAKAPTASSPVAGSAATTPAFATDTLPRTGSASAQWVVLGWESSSSCWDCWSRPGPLRRAATSAA